MSLPAEPGRHFFLVRSSLQFILAAALAQEVRSTSAGTSRLVFLPDVLDPRLFERAVARWSDAPFERIVFVTPRSRAGQSGKARSWSAVQRELLGEMTAQRPTAVTVFNDRQDAGQGVLIQAATRFPQALRECVEDGALAYTNFTYRPHGTFTRWRQRLRLGRGWSDVQVLGTHPLVQRFTTLHPALLRPELRGRNVHAFPARQLGSTPLRELAAGFCALTDFDPRSMPAGAVLLTLSHLSYAQRNPDYRRLMESCVAQLRRHSIPFVFKYHPRETEPDYLGLGAQGAVLEIPRTLPIEAVYLLLREQPLLVIAGMSTALLTAGLLMPRARIAALSHASSAGDSWDAGLLQALNIESLAQADEMAHCLDSWRQPQEH